ncbi:MAG: amidohydrolase family protein [Candidatus Hydrogenedens sp.]|nr:amidohydrolase family protein [Candidatus Hydrogenedens sp.]
MSRIVINNATLPGSDKKTSLYIDEGVLKGWDAPAGLVDAEVIDASGLVACPGLVDLRVHFCEPGFESKETLASGSIAAARGGFTTVVTMSDTHPPIDNAGMVEFVLRRAREAASIRVYTSACATKGMQGHELTEMAELKEAGVVFVSDNRRDIESSAVLRRVLEYARMVGLPYVAHCEDADLTGKGHMHEGYWSTVLGIPGMPRQAEEVRVERNIRLAEMTGAHIHIQHVSSAGAVDTIRRAKARGVRVTAETCPPYWSFTDEMVQTFDTNAKLNPPLREASDIAAVIAGLQDGTLDCIATGHAPHTPTEKEVEFAHAPFGCIGLDTALSAAITYLVQPGHLSFERVIELMSAAPARVMGLPAGTLEPGGPADLCLVDPEQPWTPTPADLGSRSRNSPFLGKALVGRVKYTLCGGRIVHYAA